jgi:hypothetical protein
VDVDGGDGAAVLTALTALTVASRPLRIRMIRLPLWPSRLNAISMPKFAGRSGPVASGRQARGDSSAGARPPPNARRGGDQRRSAGGRRQCQPMSDELRSLMISRNARGQRICMMMSSIAALRFDVASFFNVFDERTRRRTYRFFSVGLAALRRAAFVATVGFDPLAGFADCAAAALVRRTPG